jgi:hypothetical protein
VLLLRACLYQLVVVGPAKAVSKERSGRTSCIHFQCSVGRRGCSEVEEEAIKVNAKRRVKL